MLQSVTAKYDFLYTGYYKENVNNIVYTVVAVF